MYILKTTYSQNFQKAVDLTRFVIDRQLHTFTIYTGKNNKLVEMKDGKCVYENKEVVLPLCFLRIMV